MAEHVESQGSQPRLSLYELKKRLAQANSQVAYLSSQLDDMGKGMNRLQGANQVLSDENALLTRLNRTLSDNNRGLAKVTREQAAQISELQQQLAQKTEAEEKARAGYEEVKAKLQDSEEENSRLKRKLERVTGERDVLASVNQRLVTDLDRFKARVGERLLKTGKVPFLAFLVEAFRRIPVAGDNTDPTLRRVAERYYQTPGGKKK